jgi:hypothetical protein
MINACKGINDNRRARFDAIKKVEYSWRNWPYRMAKFRLREQISYAV